MTLSFTENTSSWEKKLNENDRTCLEGNLGTYKLVSKLEFHLLDMCFKAKF